MSKLAGETIAERSKIDIVNIIRPFTVIGCNGRPDQVIMKWLNRLAEGKPIYIHGFDTNRNFTYVGDVVEFVVTDLLSPQDNYSSDIYELCNPNSINLRELLDIFQKHFKDIDWKDIGLQEGEPKESIGEWNALFKAKDNREVINNIIKESL